MSQTANEATMTTSIQQPSTERDSSFIPLALIFFVGLAGIAAWLGQPMLCDLCIAEVFFISNKVVTNGASRLAFKSQAIEIPVEVKVEEKEEAKTEVSEIIEGGQVHSKKADIPDPLVPIVSEESMIEFEEPAVETTAPEVVTADIVDAVEEQLEEKKEEIIEVQKVAITDLSSVSTSIPDPEDEGHDVCSVPCTPVKLPETEKEEEVEVAILDHSQTISSNVVPEHIQYSNKRPRRVSFATPPTPPVSPPREAFAIPAGLRLPPVPVPASILTPPLSPEIQPLDFFVGIDEEIIKKEREEIHTLKIDDDWEDLVNDSDKSGTEFTLEHSLDVNKSDEKVEQVEVTAEKQVDSSTTEMDVITTVGEQVDTETEEEADIQDTKHIEVEREKQLRQQILDAFEDDAPFATHVEDVATETNKPDTQVPQTMESSMVVVTPQDALPEESEAAEESRAVSDSPTLPPPRTEVDKPTTISLNQQKPILIIVTPETEESRIIYDANNSRLPSIDGRAASTEPVKAVEIPEQKVDVVASPVIIMPTNKSNIVFTDPFFSETKKQEMEIAEKEKPLQDTIPPSPTAAFPEYGVEAVKGPCIEADDEDEPPSPHAVPEVEKKTTEELMDEITEIPQEDTPKEDTPTNEINIVKDIPETAKVIPEEAPKEVVTVEPLAIEPAKIEVNEVIEVPKVEEVDTFVSQSNTLPTLLVTTPMIPEDEELVIPNRNAESNSRPASSSSMAPSRPSSSMAPSRPSTAKTSMSSGSEPAGSSSAIDFSAAPIQRSPSAPGSVVRTANSSGDSTLFSSSMTNANAPTTPAATQKVDQKEILPKGKEIKRLTKIEEELEGWVDVAADVESYTVLIEKEKDNHYTSEEQYTEKRERHANDTKSGAKSERAIEKSPEIKSVTVIESTPKPPYPTPLQIQTPPRTYNPVPEVDQFHSIPRIPSLAQKQGGRKVHFDIDDMVAPDSSMFILPIPPSLYGDRPGSRDSTFMRPASRDSAFSSLSCLTRSPDSINAPIMPRFPSQIMCARMEPTMVSEDSMLVGGMNEFGYGSAKSRPSVEVTKYTSSGTLEWDNRIDLERGTFLGATPKPSSDFARDRDFSEWTNITRDDGMSTSELRRGDDSGTLLPLHTSPADNAPRKRWTLLRALAIPFSAFRASTDSPRSPSTPVTPNSATYLRSPDSSTPLASPRETTGFFSQFYPLSPSTPTTPATPNYPNTTSLLSPTSVMSSIDPIEPIIPNPQNQPLPIRFLKKLSPKGLITGATGAAMKAWGLVKYLTTPAPTLTPVPAISGVVERKRSADWSRGLEDIESGFGGIKMAAGRSGNEGVLIDFGEDEDDRRRRAREAGRRAALEGVEELTEVLVIPAPLD